MQEEKQSFALLFFATLAEGVKYKPGVARYEASKAEMRSPSLAQQGEAKQKMQAQRSSIACLRLCVAKKSGRSLNKQEVA
jgi:hypothetical protein